MGQVPAGRAFRPLVLSYASRLILERVGVWHTLACRSGAGLWGWGNNEYGQLGNSGVKFSPVPLPLPGSADCEQACAAEYISVALKADGSLSSCSGNGSIPRSLKKNNNTLPCYCFFEVKNKVQSYVPDSAIVPGGCNRIPVSFPGNTCLVSQ